jgi:tetratricopeptide (TPR) repeat protein
VALVLQLALLGLAIMGCIQKRYGLIAGLAFFYIALLPASRIIGAMGGVPHLAERYIYLPSVGLAIVLAFGLKWLTQRFDLRAAMAAVFMALVILTPITWARNADWASDVLLFESDYRQGNRQGQILHLLVGAHLKEKNYSRATEICDRHAGKLRRAGQLNHRCGLAYGQVGRFDDAEQSFLLAMDDPRMVAMTHTNLASMYLHLGRRSDAQKHFELAVETERNPALREYRKAYMLTKLHPSDRIRLLDAKTHLEQALQIQPQLISARQLLEQLNRILGNG